MAEEIDDDDVLEVGSNDDDSEDNGSSGKLASLKKLLSNKIILISIISVLIILLSVGAYFIFFTENDQAADSIELSEETVSEQEKIETPQDQSTSSDFLSSISENSNSPDTDKATGADGMVSEKPSRLSQISKGMVEASKNGGIPNSADDSTIPKDGAEAQMPAETPESKLLSELLTEKVAELELENQKLKEQIENLEIQIKLYKNTKRVEDLSVPVDRLGTGTISGTGLYNDGLVNDFSSDYSASPYADDEMTPKPTWGETKPAIKK